jgi:hypothetical protein
MFDARQDGAPADGATEADLEQLRVLGYIE